MAGIKDCGKKAVLAVAGNFSTDGFEVSPPPSGVYGRWASVRRPFKLPADDCSRGIKERV